MNAHSHQDRKPNTAAATAAPETLGKQKAPIAKTVDTQSVLKRTRATAAPETPGKQKAPIAKTVDTQSVLKRQNEDSEVAVVMLGWLGAKPKHLKRYNELYNSKGIHAVTFVASVMDVLSFDLGKKLEERVRKLTDELAGWLSDESSRYRYLIFHTFRNTGWLAYDVILDNLKDRHDLLEKIKGCVVDSGGDPDIDPKVFP